MRRRPPLLPAPSGRGRTGSCSPRSASSPGSRRPTSTSTGFRRPLPRARRTRTPASRAWAPARRATSPAAGGGQPSLAADPVAQRKLADLEAAAAKEPGNYALLVQLGNTAYDVENWQKAVDAYEGALKLQPGDANVMTDLGVSYRNLGNGTKALEYFGKALAKDPSHWPAAFNQAIVYGVDRGDKAKAREILLKIRKEHPEVKSVDGLLQALGQKG